MADNVVADPGSGGSTFATALGTWSGDSANFPGCFLAIISGSEGSWTFAQVVGGAGAVAAGVQRMTLASDDPLVVAAQIMDDWDESDRAKVNPIAGQAGVAAGSGTVSALTQRVVLATDVALPAGTNAIGKLAANSGVDIGDVDITSIAAGDNNIGNVDVVTLPAVTLAAAQTLATVTTVGTVTSVTTVSTVTTVSSVSSVGTVGTITPGTAASSLGKAEDAAHTSGDVGVFALAVRSDTAASTGGTDGDYSALITDSTGRLHCNVSNTLTVASHAVTNAGTFVVQIDGAALTALQLIDDLTSVAHDAADSGGPVKQGAKATTSLAGLTLVADADRTNLFAGVDGVQIVRGHSNLEDIVTATPVAITDGSSTSVLAAQGAGIKVYLTEVTIANSSASNLTVDLRDGTAGAVKWTFPVPANGGVVKTFATPLPFSANTAIAADPSAAASTITVSVLGFKSKV